MPLTSQIVHERLLTAARRTRWSRSARWFLAGSVLSLFFLSVFLALDAWLHLGPAGRWTAFALTFFCLAGGGALAWTAWRRAISEASMARRIEESVAGGGNALISAVQFDRELPAASPLRAALFKEMSDPFPAVNWRRVFDLEPLQRLGFGLGSVALVLAGWAVVQPNSFVNSAARILLPASDIAPITRTRIESLIPRDDTVVHGRDVRVIATLAGEVPKSAWVHFRQVGSSWQRALMERVAGQPVFDFAWKDVRQPFDYYVEAGDIRSPTYRVDVRPRTAIRARAAEIEPPAYTALPKQAVGDFTVLQKVVPGSKVTLMIDFNNAVPELQALDEKGNEVTARKAKATSWIISAQVMTNQAIKLVYRDDLGAPDSVTLRVAVDPDEAPKITIAEPAEGRELFGQRNANLAVKFSAADAYGLGEVAIYQSSPEREDARLIQSWPDAGGKTSFETTAQVPLSVAGDEDRVTFRVVAKDRNDVTGPGVTMSRPIVVALQSADKLAAQLNEAASKLQSGLEALIKLQTQNLDATKLAGRKPESAAFAPLVERQVQVSDDAQRIAAAADLVSPEVRNELRELVSKEMKNAVLALRSAGTVTGEPRAKFVQAAISLQAIILARLQGAPAAAEEDAKKGQIQELISGVEELLKRQRDLLRETKGSLAEKAPPLAERQDALADNAVTVRKTMEVESKNAAVGDEAFRQRLAKVAAMFGELRIYEEMLVAAEHLSTKQVVPAGEVQQRVVNNLAKIVDVLNQWQLAEAAEKAEELKKEAEALQAKLEKLAEIQREIVEKTKEMARKNEFRPEDVATAKEIQKSKDLMKEVVEQMVTDMHAFPEMKPGNEMKAELVSIYEDVIQADKQEVAEGKLKPNEIAVQKEQGILDAIERAKEIAADMEMWLPNKTEREKWLMENFEKTEMPEIPNLPLADAFEDLVGNLMEAQEELQQEIQDAASNQAFAMNPANGWEVRDGPMPGFGAQGRSGNERPNHNEQMGRSSGGREGMSDGEMAGDAATNLEGDTPEVRRTTDPLQQGQVKDDGGIGQTRATGGGKAGGFSDRQGMDGNAPLRAVKAPPTRAADALTVKQALLSEKTSKTVAEANLLYLRSDPLAQVARLMDESEQAMRDGRMRDAASLHQRIVGRLREIKSGVAADDVLSFATGDGARAADKQLLGGSEGEAPAAYKEMVADYFRALVEEK